MAIPEAVTASITFISKKAFDELWKSLRSNPDTLTPAIHNAATKASEDFFKEFGDRFGNPTTSFLARQENWDLIFESLFYSYADISADTINPEGFDGAAPATKEAIDFFIQCLQRRIKQDRALDQLFVKKQHIREQTQFKEDLAQQGDTLLTVADTIGSMAETQHAMLQMMERMQHFPVFGDQRQEDAVNSAINDHIDVARDFIAKNQPSVTISMLEQLKAKRWDTLSDQLRFRVMANIAAAKLRIGDDNAAAAQKLLEAAKLVPRDKKAIHNSAIAHWLLGNTEAARLKAEEAVALFSDDPESYRVLVITLTADEDCIDPLPKIPSEALSSPELALQLGDFFYQKGNLQESRKWCKRAYELNNTNLDIQDVYATGILGELLQENAVAVGRQITPEQRKQMEAARDILASLWEKTKDTEIASRYIPCIINLSHAQRLLGEEETSLALIGESCRRFPSDIRLKKQYLFCLINAGRTREALEVLKDLPDDAFEEKLVIEAEVLDSLDQPKEALAELNKFLSQKQPDENKQAIILAKAHRVLLIGKLEGLDAALTAAVELAESGPAVTEYQLVVSDLFARKGDREKAIEWAKKAEAACDVSGGYPERARVADTYFDLGLHRKAAYCYERLITSYGDSRNLRRLLSAYMAGDFRKEALDLVSRLPADTRKTRFFARACAELFYRLGELSKAQKYLEGCLESSTDDLEVHLNYLTLLERMQKKEDGQKLLEGMPVFQNASPEDFVRLSHAYARHGLREKALETGYKALKRFGSSATVHLGYCGLILEGLENIPEIDRIREEQRVEVDTTFVCTTDSGKMLTYVIEAHSANEANGEISPEHHVARKAIGLKVGDRFAISETPFGKEEARITEVKHKYLHALHDTMTNFQYRFPGVPGMWMVSLRPTADGGLDLQPVLDMVSRKSDSVQRAEKAYQNHPLPLSLVARSLGVHPLDCFIGMIKGGRIKIKCCNGDAIERGKALQTALSAKEGFILDPFSLFTLYSVQALDAILLLPNRTKPGVTQSTIDFFAELIEERRQMRPHMSVSEQGGQFFRDEISEDDITQSIAPLEAIVSWCRENCAIIPAVGKPGSNEQAKELFAGLHPAFLDSLLAAWGTGRVLISEDWHYRQVASLLFNVEGVWSQPLLQAVSGSNCISSAVYHDAMLRLIKMNFTFISIDSDDLIYQLKKTVFVVNEDFTRMISTTAAPGTEIVSSTIVFANLVSQLFQQEIPLRKTENIMYAALNHLTLNPTRPQVEIVKGLHKMLGWKMMIGQLDQRQFMAIRGMIGQWCFGHFLLHLSRQ